MKDRSGGVLARLGKPLRDRVRMLKPEKADGEASAGRRKIGTLYRPPPDSGNKWVRGDESDIAEILGSLDGYNLKSGEDDFVSSLRSFFEERGGLTTKQYDALVEVYERVQGRD